MSARIVLISGKGGVGKTSFAAATGLAAARRGKRTLVMSFDLAHSLADSLDLQTKLFGTQRGQPRAVEHNLSIQELDLYEELERQWGDTLQIVSGLMYGGNSLQGTLSSEVGIMPGLEELVALSCLQQRYESGDYDLIVVDCPPTGEALGFIGFVSLLESYVEKRLPLDRRFCRAARPIATTVDPSLEMFFPADRHFEVLERVGGRMAAVSALLRDPATSTVRLVTNPERAVVEETRRAFMYFSMYGMTVDAVVMNRTLPKDALVYAQRVTNQEHYLESVVNDFAPTPVLVVPWQPYEVVGVERLAQFANLIYGDLDPAAAFISETPYRVIDSTSDGERYRMQLKLPFIDRSDVELERDGHELALKIGPFRRLIMLPRVLRALPVRAAKLDGEWLTIGFGAS